MKTTSATKENTTAKTVTPLFRVQIKATGQVVYRVRNGEDREYLVTISGNGNTGCTQCANDEACPSTKSGRKCYHIKECLKLEDARVEASYNGYTAEGVSANHAVEKVQRVSKAADLGMTIVEYLRSLRTPEVVLQLSAACLSPEVIAQLEEEERDAKLVCERYPLPEEVFPLDHEREEDEEFREEVAEQWTQEEIAAIRQAAVIAPQAPEYSTEQKRSDAPLNGNHGFNLLRV